MSPRLLLPEDLERLVLGASVLGTGGGGSFSMGRDLVRDLGARHLTPTLLSLEDLPSEAMGVSTVILGGGLSHEDLEGMGMISDQPASWSGAQALSRYLGRPIDFVFPIELGPQNTLEAVRLAAFLGVPILDGDCAGRAVPEMHQTTLSLFDIPLAPYAITTFQGDSAIVCQASSDARHEAICRALAQASGGVLNVTGFPVTGAQLREAILPGTLTRCMAVGEVLQGHPYPADQLVQRLGGVVGFRGQVSRYQVDTAGGFFRGAVTLEGRGAEVGHTCVVGFQNEFLWSWRDGGIAARCPDLICVIDSRSGLGKVTYGHGFENAIEVGQDLTVLVLPADPVWNRGPRPNPFPPPPSLEHLLGAPPC